MLKVSPDGSTFDPATKTFTWTPTVNQGQPAPYMVTFSVSDGTESDTEVVAITVTNVNQPPNPPTLSGDAADGSITVNENIPVSFTVTGTDRILGYCYRYSRFLTPGAEL